MNDLPALRRKVQAIVAHRRLCKERVMTEQLYLVAAQQRLDVALQGQQILQGLAEKVQEQAHEKIAHLVTSCLAAVFGDDAYEFKIRFDRKRGKTEAVLLFCRDGQEIDPMDAAGGGAVDVAAFALRLTCLLLAKPPCRRLLVVDEPFRFLSEGYRPAVRELLERLSKELKVQIVMVTHSSELMIGDVIELE